MALDIANTVLNASPYFDDFNEEKNFHRVLFRPSVAVQAREVNQVQSILQNQIERFGQHIFKDGTIIKGCGLSYLESIDYVSINDQFTDNTSLSSTNTQFVNAIAVGNTSGVVAQIISAREGFKSSSNPARFFVKYTQPGFNNERTFAQGEYLNLYQPGKSYIDKVILQVNTVTTVNTTNFPVGSKLVNQVSLARGFVVNAYANTSGNFVELRNVRKTFNNNDTVVLSTDTAVTANVITVDYESYANSFVDSVQVLTNNTDLGYTSLGFGYGVAVSPGIIFHKGHFVRVDSHITIINENSSDPSGKVLYFNTTETVVKETDDNSLYDNASGTTNINAPGAHRLKLTSTLIAKDKVGANSISNTDIAFPIVEFGNSGPVFQKTNTEYNIIGDELAKRTYDESGHYVIKPFTLSTKPHGSDKNKLVFEVGQGLAYVKGRAIEFLNNQNIEGRRGIDTVSEIEKTVSMSFGNYIVVNELRGYFPVDQSVEVRFYDTAQAAVTGEVMPGESPTGTIVGYANVRAVKYIESTNKKGSPSAEYRIYIFNYRSVGSYTFQNAKSVVYNNGSTNLAFADLVLNTASSPAIITGGTDNWLAGVSYDGSLVPADFDWQNYLNHPTNPDLRLAQLDTQIEAERHWVLYGRNEGRTYQGFARLQESSSTPLLFGLNAKAVKDLRASNGEIDTNYYYTGANTTAQIIDTTGTITFGLGAAKGILGFSDGSESSKALVDIIVKDANCSTSALVGTVAASATNIITGTSTLFTEDFVPGECIEFIGAAATRRIVSITNATSMVVNSSVSAVANTYRRVHIRGSSIALNPAAGSKRTLTVASDRKTATVNLGNTYTGTANVAVRFYAYNNDANPITKAMNRNSVVIINTANNVGGSKGPWSLGISDVVRLTGVYLGTNSTNFTLSSNRLADFVLDNGQRDTHYDHASISVSPTSNLSVSNNFLLVKFDCFTANATAGEGFFCVESYPVNDALNANTTTTIRTWEIPSYTSVVGNTALTYDLRDVVDFRPYKANTANLTTSFLTATVNPALTSNSFDANTTTYNPFPGSTLITNFTYYLGRKDRLTLTSEGIFKIEEGLPDAFPRFSPMNAEVLNVAEVSIPPYPSLTDIEKFTADRNDYNIKVDVLTHKRFTMKDISILEKRIERLEYYTTLNMLESIALQTNVTDSSGEQRFQNGFFVDPFNSHVFGRTSDADYKIAIDEQNGLLRPAFEPQVIEMEFDTTANSYSNVAVTGNMVTLAYEHESFIDQPFASDVVNVSGVPIAWNGTIDVRPTVRNDVEYLAKPIAVSSSSRVAQAYDSMAGVTPGTAQYGWWRDNVQNNEDYNVKKFDNDARDATSVPVESGRYVTTEDGQKVSSGVVYLSKERVYAFRAVGLKPNTIHYLFVNNNNNSDFAALGELSSTPNAGDEKFVTRTSPWGTVLETDSRGEIIGKFVVPALTLKSGTHKLTIRNRNTLTRGLDDSFAEAYFTIDIATIDPPVIVTPNTPGPPDANTPANTGLPPTGNTSDPPPSGNTVTANNDPRVKRLPKAFARFVYTGDTTVYGTANSSGYLANGAFTLTFTDDSYVKDGSITAYAWNFGAVSGIVNCSSNTATGVGPHTITFQTINAVTDVNVTLTITDSAANTKEHSQVIRLSKLPKICGLTPVDPTATPNTDIALLSTLINDVSDPFIYAMWKPYQFNPTLADTLDLPYNLLTYNGGTSLGGNTVLRIIAKPCVDFEGSIGWTVTPITGSALRSFTEANLTQVYVTSGGTGYSNTDTIRFSNGQVDAFATMFTDSSGSIQYVQLSSRGNFTDGTAVTQETFTANSTVYNNFTLSTSSSNTSVLVTVNGLVQTPGVDYQITGGGTTLNFTVNLDYSVSPDVVVVSYNVTGVTPGTNIKTADQIRIQIANTTHPANSTNGNTSAGSGAVLTLVPGVVYNSTTSSPRVTDDTITLYSNTTTDTETVVLVKADFYLANGYANSIGNTSQTFTLRNTSTAPSGPRPPGGGGPTYGGGIRIDDPGLSGRYMKL